MPVATTTILGLIAASAAAVGTGASIKSSMDAKDQAEDAANQQKAQQDNQIAQLQAQKTDQTASDNASNALFQRDKSRADIATAQASQGRSGTILTSPLGITNAGTPSANTIGS